MTNEQLIKYYVDLLIIQYTGKPKASATIEMLADQFIANQLPVQVQDAFSIFTATGKQLDILGKYAGVQRTSVGFSNQIILTDTEFRQLIQLAIIKNSYGSSLYDIDVLLQQFFGDQIKVFDYLGMRMSYFVDSEFWSSDLLQVAVSQNMLPYPMAVERGAVIFADDINSFFGFVSYRHPVALNNSPFNTYEDYQMDWPWLTYEYALTPDNITNINLLTEGGDDLLQEDDGGIFL